MAELEEDGKTGRPWLARRPSMAELEEDGKTGRPWLTN
jgi:hypothetical protein